MPFYFQVSTLLKVESSVRNVPKWNIYYENIRKCFDIVSENIETLIRRVILYLSFKALYR